jgi:2-methylcitrate dehydratase
LAHGTAVSGEETMALANESPARASVTATLAAEVATTPLASIPKAALDGIRRLIVDHVGITYMGYAFTGQALHAYADDVGGGRPEAVLIGSGKKVTAEIAAGVNAQICRNTDFEETGPAQHIGPLTVHTALAVGQRAHASGREILAAAALGYVLNGRFHFARRGDNTAPQHRVTAAAIASRLLGYDTAKTARAISLAWEFPMRPHFFPLEIKAPTPKRVSALGMGALFHARVGVQATLMAGHGFTSLPDEIDQGMGDYDVAALTRPATPWDVVTDHMELKPWVCSRGAQCAMQAVSTLVQDHAIDPRAVTAVRLRLSKMYTRPHQFDPAPNTYWEAIYSTQWATAMVLQGIPAGPKWVTAERLADPFSRQLAAMVEITEDPESTRAYMELRRLETGGAAEIVVGNATHRAAFVNGETYGSPKVPMTDAMLEAKFLEVTSLSMAPERARALLSALRRLEEVDDINRLAEKF